MALSDYPYSFAPQAIVDPTTNLLVPNATSGQVVDPATGNALPMADLNGNTISQVTGTSLGASQWFRSTQLAVLVKFGNATVGCVAVEQFDLATKAAAQVTAAQAAQAAAVAASTSAAQSATSAQSAASAAAAGSASGIADGGISTQKLADASVTGVKLAAGAAVDDSSTLTTGTPSTAKGWSAANAKAQINAGVAAGISGLVNGAGTALDTLGELATALGNNPNLATTLTGMIGGLSSLTTTVKTSLVDAVNEVVATMVKVTGTQTIAGAKTFSSPVSAADPLTDTHLVTRGYYTANLPAGGAAPGAVRYDTAQAALTAAQRAQARTNSSSLADGPARFHVADYGVLGDGTTDDYPAFLACNAAAIAYVQANSRPAIVDFEGMGTILFNTGGSLSVARQSSAGANPDSTIAGYNKLGMPVPPLLLANLRYAGNGTIVKGSAACICFAYPDRTAGYQVWQNLTFDRVTWDDTNVGTVKGHCIWGNQPSFGVKMRYTSLQDFEALDCVVLGAQTDTSTSVGGGAMSRAAFFWTGDQNSSSEATQTFTRRIRTRGGIMNGGDQLYAFYCTVADRYRAGGATMGGCNHLHDDIDIGDNWRHVNTAWTPTQQRYQTSVYIGGSTNAGGRCSIGSGYVENIGDDCIEVGGMMSTEITGVRCKDPLFNLILFRNTGPVDSARQVATVRRTRTQVTTALSSLTGTFAAPFAWIADDLYLQVGYTGTVTGGTFTITIPLYSGTVTTAAIAWNATAAQVAAAIDAVVPVVATGAPNGGVTGYSGGTVNSTTPTVFVLVKQGISTIVPVSVTSSLTGGGTVSVGIAPQGTAFGRYVIEDPWFEADGLNQSRQGRTSLTLKGPENGVPILGIHVVRPRVNLLNYTYTNAAVGYQIAAICRAVSLYANWPTELSVQNGIVRARGCNLAGGSGSAIMSMVSSDGYGTLLDVDGLVTDFSGSQGGTWGDVLVGQNFGSGLKAFVKRLKRRGQATGASYFGMRLGTEAQITIPQLSESDFGVYGTPGNGLLSYATGTYGAANVAAISSFANTPASVNVGGGGGGAAPDNTTGAGASTTASWSGATSQAQVTAAHDTAVADAGSAGDAKYATLSALNGVSGTRRYPRPRFTLFPRQAAWVVSGTGVTIAQSTTSFSPMGTGSQVVSSPGTSGVNKIARFTNTASVDMTGKMLGFWLKLPDMSHVSSLNMYAYDSTGTANFTFSIQMSASKNIHPGEWAEFVIPWAPTTSSGGPLRTDIRQIRFECKDDGAGVALTWEFGDQLFTVPEPTAFPTGVVSFCFDDSYDLSLAQPKLASYGIPATLFPILGNLDGSTNLKSADARKWVDTLGWEIAGHAATQADHVSLPTLTSADQVANLARLRAAMNSFGFNSPVYGQPNAAADIVSDGNIRQFFSVSRGGSDANALESLPPGRPMFLRSMFAGSNTPAQLQAGADKALAAKGWAIITFHSVVASGPDSLGITQTNFNTVIDYIAGLAVEKLTISDVLGRLT